MGRGKGLDLFTYDYFSIIISHHDCFEKRLKVHADNKHFVFISFVSIEPQCWVVKNCVNFVVSDLITVILAGQ